MARRGRFARLAGLGVFLIALALPCVGAAAQSAEPQRGERKPYAMVLAGLGLIAFIARRRTKALNAGD